MICFLGAVVKRFAAAGGHDDQGVALLQDVGDDVGLQVIAEDGFEEMMGWVMDGLLPFQKSSMICNCSKALGVIQEESSGKIAPLQACRKMLSA